MKKRNKSKPLSPEPFYCGDTNLSGVAARAWSELVLRPAKDFIAGSATVAGYIDSLDVEPTVITHWGTVLTLSQVMNYHLYEKMP